MGVKELPGEMCMCARWEGFVFNVFCMSDLCGKVFWGESENDTFLKRVYWYSWLCRETKWRITLSFYMMKGKCRVDKETR